MTPIQKQIEDSLKTFDEKFIDKIYGLDSWNDRFTNLGGAWQVTEIKSNLLLSQQKLLETVIGEIEKMKEEGRVGEGWVSDGQRMVERFGLLISLLQSSINK